MNFELLTEQKFNKNFGSFEKSEYSWVDIDESVVDLLLYARYKDESESIKIDMLKGRSIPAIVGYIRLKNDLCKCPLCGSSFEEGYGALSIVDNETEICSNCGAREQLERYFKVYER